MSAESGIPTFRGADGLWKNFRAEDLATPEAFAANPRLVWEWYDWRRGLIAAAKPNPAHLALAAFDARRLTLITQNVDGLHDLAGSTGVLKIHGDIWVRRCVACRLEETARVTPLPDLPPLCPACGAMQRPGVVWFGEGLPEDVWLQSQEVSQACDVFLVIGTSAQVYPAASLVPLARRSGAKIIEVNIARSGISSAVDAFLEGPAGEILPALLAAK